MKNDMNNGRLRLWCNALGYMVVWWGSVLAARNDVWWLGPLFAILFTVWHLLSRTLITGEFVPVVIIAFAGFLFDSLLMGFNLVEYQSGWGENEFLAPLWIGGIWLAFALTINHSFKAFLSRPIIAILLGVIGGPLTYRGAVSLGAISLTQPTYAFIALSVGWGVMMWLMSRFAVLKESE